MFLEKCIGAVIKVASERWSGVKSSPLGVARLLMVMDYFVFEFSGEETQHFEQLTEQVRTPKCIIIEILRIALNSNTCCLPIIVHPFRFSITSSLRQVSSSGSLMLPNVTKEPLRLTTIVYF